MAAISLESSKKRKAPVATFPAFEEISNRTSSLIRQYFKKFIECINLEQTAELAESQNNGRNIGK